MCVQTITALQKKYLVHNRLVTMKKFNKGIISCLAHRTNCMGIIKTLFLSGHYLLDRGSRGIKTQYNISFIFYLLSHFSFDNTTQHVVAN